MQKSIYIFFTISDLKPHSFKNVIEEKSHKHRAEVK